jgi:hypothetical protein
MPDRDEPMTIGGEPPKRYRVSCDGRLPAVAAEALSADQNRDRTVGDNP